MMVIRIVYSHKTPYIETIANELARYLKVRATKMDDFEFDEPVDLLIVAFGDSFLKDKDLEEFMSQIDRSSVHNVIFVTGYYFNNKKLKSAVDLAYKYDVPLMRQQYCFKQSLFKRNEIETDVIDDARVYLEDMVNIVRDYY